MKKRFGTISLIIGTIITIVGAILTTSDQYKEEVYFEGFYGADTMYSVRMTIAIGIIMIVVGLILVLLKNKENESEVSQNGDKPMETSEYGGNNGMQETSIISLLRRAEIFLEDGDFNSADKYFDRVLDVDPECSKAYIGRLLVELKLKKENELANCGADLTKNGNYKKAVKFADETYREILEQFDLELLKKKEIEYKEGIYNDATDLMNNGNTINDFLNSSNLFRSISGYKDSDSLAVLCDESSENLRIEIEEEKEANLDYSRLVRKNTKKNMKYVGIAISVLVVIVLAITLVSNVLIPNFKYTQANKLLENKQYDDAIAAFSKLNVKDSDDKIIECKYEIANTLLENKQYDDAIDGFSKLNDFKDSDTKVLECHYNKAISLFENKNYDEAIKEFEFVGRYEDSHTKVDECHYNMAISFFENKMYDEAVKEFEFAGRYEDSYTKVDECHYNMAISFFENNIYDEAAKEFVIADGYKDSEIKIKECNSNYKSYMNKTYGFFINYPCGFEVDECNEQFDEIYIYNPTEPRLYTKISFCSTSLWYSIEDAYKSKLNQVTNKNNNDNNNVYYKKLQENEFVIYWENSKMGYCYRGVYDDTNNVSYYIYIDYHENDKKYCDPIAKEMISSFFTYD